MKKPSSTECTACGLYFSGITAFDLHRVGPYADTMPHPDGQTRYYRSSERRCMNASEMLQAGLVLKNDVWRFPAGDYFKVDNVNLEHEKVGLVGCNGT
jgi:hypothetical protein